jgi:glucose-6-phosphate 1-dehydrogenase
MFANPLLDGLQFSKEPTPFVITIFGATGDLTRRKLIPALFSLFLKGNISQFKIVGFARRPWTTQSFQDEVRQMIAGGPFASVPEGQKRAFLEKLDYVSSTFDAAEGYAKLAQIVQGWEGRLFYLSTPPDEYESIIRNLGAQNLNGATRGYSRIIVEKPFGRDLATAKELNDILATVFDENQIYRIDHYLGKETVQNILVLRFGNGIFEPLWNNRYIDHIQITVAESLGVGTRGNYYEKSGALRDMVQSHIFQLMALLTMEPPNDLSPDTIRTEKVKILKSLRPITFKDVNKYTVRGQYSEGIVQGQSVKGYLEEEGVDPNSRTETFVALKIFLDTWRWEGVPIFIRTGKSLGRRVSEVAISFKEPPLHIFKNRGSDTWNNTLVIHIQPEEGITFNINAKIPGYTTQVRPVNMDFAYGNAFGEATPEAYERLLLDALVGDSTLYTRRDDIETSWAFITRILQGWAEDPNPLPQYRAGGSGPDEAKNLLGSLHQKWRKL